MIHNVGEISVQNPVDSSHSNIHLYNMQTTDSRERFYKPTEIFDLRNSKGKRSYDGDHKKQHKFADPGHDGH